MTRFLTFLAVVLCSSALQAQTYPTRSSDGINDFANVIDEETEARITEKLAALLSEHDTEVTIATLSSLRFYAEGSTIEEYTTGLFNTWAIGDEEENNGILVIMFRDDREVRVQLGSGYGDDIRTQTNRVVESDILPFFRNQDYSGGLEAGVDGLLTRVIDPAEVNTTTPVESGEDAGSSNTLYYILGGVAAAIAGLIGLNRRNAAKFAQQACTNCGKTGLQKSREVLKPATLEEEGAGENRIICPSCGHVDATSYTISKLRPEEPKGGGQTKGDGSTGKW